MNDKKKIPSIFLTLLPITFGLACIAIMTDIHTISDIISIDPFSWKEVLTSIAIGSMVGWERQLRGKPIGMRTSVMIILATYAFVAMSYHVSTNVLSSVGQTMTDPSRVIGQVISGVGFLGAGVMFTRKGSVNGVTSAAMIWFLAAMGVCVASGFGLMAIKLTTLCIIVLILLDNVDDFFVENTKRFFHHKPLDFKYKKDNKEKTVKCENKDLNTNNNKE